MPPYSILGKSSLNFHSLFVTLKLFATNPFVQLFDASIQLLNKLLTQNTLEFKTHATNLDMDQLKQILHGPLMVMTF